MAYADLGDDNGLGLRISFRGLARTVSRIAPRALSFIPVVGPSISSAVTNIVTRTTGAARTATREEARRVQEAVVDAARATPAGRALERTAIGNAVRDYWPLLAAAGVGIFLLARRR